eukprot:TRINITY_DN2083_c0_g1_i2.p2 TRINITY_DN2083_c0_g1~~TRINITY_DN2083_c0_g1_i2.p2  ORF type:complete len:363 (+),score=108.80 TRINITY_DN2083_c0_g1_i2:54-1142(+)
MIKHGITRDRFSRFFLLVFNPGTLMAVTSLSWVRRNHWYVFAVTHSLYAVVFPMAWIHYPSLMIFMVVPLCLYLLDLFMREASAYCTATRLVAADARPGVTKLTIARRGFAFKPLQYVLLNLSFDGEGSDGLACSQQWHPFSIASGPREGGEQGETEFTVFIKDQGEGAARFTHLVQKVTPDWTVRVQGPFGAPSVPFTSGGYERIVLCTGGVGITPALSFVDSLVNSVGTSEPVNEGVVLFVWSGRGAAGFAPFGKELAQLHRASVDAKGNCTVQWELHNTEKDLGDGAAEEHVPIDLDSEEDPVYKLPVKRGRPSWEKLLSECKGKKTAVFACGPPQLVDEAEQAAYAHGADFHKEVFMF